jgi:archaellum component FlaF (FlaF/FlaG flagellin family)
MKTILTSLALSLSAAIFFSSCSKENAYQTDANQQNSLESQQKTQQLNQVTGTYTGQMQLAQGPLDVKIYLYVGNTTVSEPDQIDKLQVPTLLGNLTFTVMQNESSSAAISSFPDLIQAMGGKQITVTNGDFNVNNSMITLTYNSNGSTAGDDQVIGTFQNGVFTGEWDSHSGGEMGTFTVERSGS